jgi:hypothetical protein
MSSNRNIYKRERIKNDILKGKQHLAHYSDKLMPARVQKSFFECDCPTKCSSILTDNQKKEVFERYNSLKSHSEQYLFLKTVVIPINSNDKKRREFHYFIEYKSNENEVKIR